jgi:hypothetical protein
LDDANHDFLWIPKADMADFLAKVPWLSSNLAFWYQYIGDQEKYDVYILKFGVL